MSVDAPLVSIIIPCYNLQSCVVYLLDSVISQTYENLEIICVDDGSTDDTVKVLTEYSEKDDRIAIIRQANQGQAVARNTGAAMAHGEYIAFIDGDDCVAPEYIERLIECETKHPGCMAITGFADVTIATLKNTAPFASDGVRQAWRAITIDELLYRDLVSCCWGRMAPAELFREHPLSQRYYEDVAIGAEYLGACLENLYYLDEPLYYHVRRQGSTVNASSVTVEQIDDYARALEKQSNTLEAMGVAESALRYMRALHLTRVYRTALRSNQSSGIVSQAERDSLQEIRTNLPKLLKDKCVPRWNKVRFFVFAHMPTLYNAAFNFFVAVRYHHFETSFAERERTNG